MLLTCLILQARPLFFRDGDKVCMMITNVLLSKTPGGWGAMLCNSGPICVISLYIVCRYTSFVNLGLGWVASTPVFLSRHHLKKDCQLRLMRLLVPIWLDFMALRKSYYLLLFNFTVNNILNSKFTSNCNLYFCGIAACIFFILRFA